MQSFGLGITALTVTFDGGSGIAKVFGVADDPATKNEAIRAAGNVEGVAGIDEHTTVTVAAPEAQHHTVVKGDTLSKIAKDRYGNANATMRIFDANQPVLTHPDKIYPGQQLRMPAE